MKLVIRGAILLAAAGGFVVALALTSSADVVEPSSAYQPYSASLIENNSSQAAGLPGEETVGSAALGEAPQIAETRETPPATPAPESQVRPARASIARVQPVSNESPLERAVRPLGVGLQKVGSFLERVVSACHGAVGTGAGVPVLALAVLSVAAAFDRRRVLGIRTATDEDVPELLYAREVIAPG